MRFAPPLYPACRLDPGLPTGLLLLGMGGPDGQDAVEPFLTNLFADPLVLPVPRWLSRPLGRLIVRRRVDEVRARYRDLGHGGGSPQLDWTRRQAIHLASLLGERGLAVQPGVAMRYWHPFTGDALADLRRQDVRQLAVVPTYPQFSVATTGTSLAELERALRELRWAPPRHVMREWPLLPGYVDHLAGRAAAVLAGWRAAGKDPARTALVYTAHSLPERFARGGDPYARQTRATVRAAHRRLCELVADRSYVEALAAGGAEPVLAFQSKVGPVRWLGPATVRTCLDLVTRRGVRHLVVVPVSFSCEHIETIDELDRELGAALRDAGLVDFARTPALNLEPGWLDSLADRVASRAFGVASAGRQEIPHA
ncbi:MAG TPA: ferrochelatase [Candidatus Krumholzibacteria bacterium]|nr:ferrochelatase [Candidatus Krumholzibacteria bacterium]HPD71181.1 ferrochelatase [Candidatus Krumholzibacteria bacterium]HRY39119.1 ferrochelatase [Candidatus Krumholzibacteria bacterium]